MTVLEKKQKTWNTKLFVRIIPTLDLDFDSIKIEKNKQVRQEVDLLSLKL